MFLEVEVSEGSNSPLSLTRMFDTKEQPVPVTRIISGDLDGNDTWCDVTGWSEAGPCPAYAALVEDSGEGVARLIYGGDHGIRLKRSGLDEPWDLASPRQWGEACLLLDKDAEVA